MRFYVLVEETAPDYGDYEYVFRGLFSSIIKAEESISDLPHKGGYKILEVEPDDTQTIDVVKEFKEGE